MEFAHSAANSLCSYHIALGGVFKIDWVCRKDLPFQGVSHLSNPWNDGKPVKIGRDGQEIEPSELKLCNLSDIWPLNDVNYFRSSRGDMPHVS